MRACPHKLAAAIASAFAASASAVSLSTDGRGQALIFPYYTVRSSEGGNAFNTYLSIVSTTTLGKSVRVRFREGRAARPVLDFNLFLAPNDVWTAALVPVEGSNEPGAGGTRLLTRDRSCTDPPLPSSDGVASIDFSASSYTGGNSDGFGTGLERTREGFVEVIETATLSGVAAFAITHNSAGVPQNCGYIHANPTIPAAMLVPPTGGLAGTGTLINVVNGRDFSVPVTALAGLSLRPFHRHYSDPYPDFFAAEIDPESVVVANGQAYRSAWEHSVDAVSAVLMRHEWLAEYVLDDGTRSLTDLVATLPTRHFYVDATRFTPPFSVASRWGPVCGDGVDAAAGERLAATVFNRAQQALVSVGSDTIPSEPRLSLGPRLCADAAVASLRNSAAHMPADMARSAVLGSTTLGFLHGGFLEVGAFRNGWTKILAPRESSTPQARLVSLPSSTRVDLASGQVIAGSHAFAGLPVIGFALRTFTNGTLTCAGAPACQGNYGGAFEFKYRRSISPP